MAHEEFSEVWELLVGFFGDLGSFKTATMTAFLRDDAFGGSVFTNYFLSFKNCKKMAISEMFGLHKLKIGRGSIGVDELPMIADSRISSSKTNLFMGYFTAMSRKMGWDVYYTSQLASAVDKREFTLTDLKIVCLGLKDGFVRYKYIFGSNPVKSAKVHVSFFERFVFPFYDTFEIVEPLRLEDLVVEMQKFDTDKINATIDDYVRVVMKEFGYRNYKEVQKFEIEDFLLRHGFSSSVGGMVTNRYKSLLKKKKDVSRKVESVDTQIDKVVSSSDRWNRLRR